MTPSEPPAVGSEPARRVDLSQDGAFTDSRHLADQLASAEETGVERLCIDGLPEILHHQGTEDAFRILHALTAVAKRRDWAIHIHLDPTTVDARTLRALATPVDAVVHLEEGMPIVVREPRSTSR